MAYLTVMVRQSRPDLVLGLVLLVLSTPFATPPCDAGVGAPPGPTKSG